MQDKYLLSAVAALLQDAAQKRLETKCANATSASRGLPGAAQSPEAGVLRSPAAPNGSQGSPRGQAAHRFGDLCWEFDAMSPNDLRARVTAAIEDELDHEAWNRYLTAEQVERESITKTLKAWKSISGLARE